MEEILNELGSLNYLELIQLRAKVNQHIANRLERKRLQNLLYPKNKSNV